MNRRDLLRFSTVAGLILAVPKPLYSWGGSSAFGSGPASGALDRQPELTGAEFNLELAPLPVDFTGCKRLATAINGHIPAPLKGLYDLLITNRLILTPEVESHLYSQANPPRDIRCGPGQRRAQRPSALEGFVRRPAGAIASDHLIGSAHEAATLPRGRTACQ